MLPNNMFDSHIMCVQTSAPFNATSVTTFLDSQFFYKQSLIIKKFVIQEFTKLVGFLVTDLLVLSGLEYCPVRHYEL